MLLAKEPGDVLAQVLPEVQNAQHEKGHAHASSQSLNHPARGVDGRHSRGALSANAQIQKLTIKGSVTYEAGAALPPGSRAVIELRHVPALPDAPAVTDQRIDLEGKQSPVPFEFTLERFKLVGGATYFVRGAIVSEKRAIWTADDIKIDVTQSTVDVKEITLRPVK